MPAHDWLIEACNYSLEDLLHVEAVDHALSSITSVHRLRPQPKPVGVENRVALRLSQDGIVVWVLVACDSLVMDSLL